MLPRSDLTPDSSRPCWLSRCCCWRILGPRLRRLDHNREQRLGVSTKIHHTQNSLLFSPKWPQLDELATLKIGRVIYFIVKLKFIASLFCIQGWHILRIKFKKSSPADKIGFNWRKLDKSGENWRKLILTIGGECKGQVF